MAAKFFTGLPVDGPDPECVQGHGQAALARERTVPAPSRDHSRRTPTRPVGTPNASSKIWATAQARSPSVSAPKAWGRLFARSHSLSFIADL